jgi:hypothetical protein
MPFRIIFSIQGDEISDLAKNLRCEFCWLAPAVLAVYRQGSQNLVRRVFDEEVLKHTLTRLQAECFRNQRFGRSCLRVRERLEESQELLVSVAFQLQDLDVVCQDIQFEPEQWMIAASIGDRALGEICGGKTGGVDPEFPSYRANGRRLQLPWESAL